MRSFPIVPIPTKAVARALVGGCTQTSKMPCESYSLPTGACITGARMAEVPGSICSGCYANKGFYQVFEQSIVSAQLARLASLWDPLWASAMAKIIDGKPAFRWHDSGDLQGPAHLLLIVEVARATPATLHWLPTREFAMVAEFIATYGRNSIPPNLIIRLSAMFPDQPVTVPASLKDVPGVAIANVHNVNPPHGVECLANQRGGKCGECRACWSRDVDAVSYRLH